MLVDDGDGDAFGCVRLLLTELAAALHVEVNKVLEPVKGGAAGRNGGVHSASAQCAHCSAHGTASAR
eukprot:6455757-Prymnesium_polylepis.1